MFICFPNASLIFGWVLSSFNLFNLFLFFFSDPGVPLRGFELVEVVLLGWMGAGGGGGGRVDGPAVVAASCLTAAGGGRDPKEGSTGGVDGKLLAVCSAGGGADSGLGVGHAGGNVARLLLAWGVGVPIEASLVEAGGDAGADHTAEEWFAAEMVAGLASASRNSVTGGGGGGRDDVPTVWDGAAVVGGGGVGSVPRFTVEAGEHVGAGASRLGANVGGGGCVLHLAMGAGGDCIRDFFSLWSQISLGCSLQSLV